MEKIDFSSFKNCLKDQAWKVKLDSRKENDPEKDDDGPYFNCLNPYQLDIIKITNSKAIRRLRDKAQVFAFPPNPHVRTRSVHTLEVVNTATIISEILGLNVLLAQAIAYGHDIGHAPYGHLGESIIMNLSGRKFRHEIFSAVVAMQIERKGKGLNLTREVLEGILRHSRGGKEMSIDADMLPEHAVVMLSDKIAYTFSDINDAKRFGYLEEVDVPRAGELGKNQRERTSNCIHALVKESAEKGRVAFSESEAAKIFSETRKWMYEHVYSEVDKILSLQKEALRKTYEFFATDKYFADCDPAILLALLTDKEVTRLVEIFLVSRHPRIDDIRDFGVFETIERIRGRQIDIEQAKIDW
jgi:dGTPase